MDVASLVSQIMQSERRSLAPLQKEASSNNSLLSNFSSIKSAITTFQSALDGLNNLSFTAQKASISNTGTGTNKTSDAFTATVNSDAGTKAISQKIQSAAIASGTTFTNGDTIGIQIGSGAPVFVTLGSDMGLEGVRDAINNGKTGVTASIQTTAAGQHLVFESQTAGTANTIKVTGVGTMAQFVYGTSQPTTMTQTQAARDLTSAASGSHNISVAQLAQAHKLKSAAIDETQTFTNGILAIKTSSGSTSLITPKNNTLAGVRDAINASDAGVSASIVSDGTKSHLVISSKETGTGSSVKVTGTGDFSVFNFDPSGKLSSKSFDGAHTFGAGTLKLGHGNATVDLNVAAGATLDAIKNEINNHTTATGITATVVADGANQRLELTTSNGESISLTGTDSFADLTNNMMGESQKAQDAKVVIDGVTVTSKTNKVENAITGISLDLQRPTAADDIYSMSVSNDSGGINTAINKFIDAYNALSRMLTEKTAYNQESKVAGALQGDSTARSIMTQMYKTMTETVAGNGAFSTLAAIGVTYQTDGTFKVEADKLLKVTTTDFNAIGGLLNTETGILGKMQALVKDFLSDEGALKSRMDSIEKTLRENGDRQQSMELRFTSMQERYTKQFNNLDLMLAKMQSQSSSLASALASLPSTAKK